MSGKGGYPAGSAPPPPPAQYYPNAGAPPPYAGAPPAYGAGSPYPVQGSPYPVQGSPYPVQGAQGVTIKNPGNTTVVIQQRPVHVAPKPKTSHGILGSLSKELDIAGNMFQREMNYVGNQITGAVDRNAQTSLLQLFRTNNIIQLIANTSGKALQVVMNPAGQLVVDGLGREGPQAEFANAHWTVINEGNNQVRLHNNMNFLAISNGYTVVLNAAQFPHIQQGAESKFQLSQVGLTHFVALESLAEKGRHVGILRNGQLKSAVATTKNPDGQFGVRLIYSPYPPAGK